ncbi:hypothetical protein HBI25_138120 [Parastagonospora nodorum]|nr:hypothetical protein HBH54_094520 [Parastagonospora nodorum]KAH4159446.1 hypothetical protein HBH44_104330 [Parastagonospora nodorum]KAH5520274.1 hypothetical protein HBI29_060340 [Parastagonospora nodorum]KAH5557150.1 hypothetical protein HBI25_138120 [Parastagonospora nodorum]KAH5596593.1 hypothetical protein HBI45_176260 [Parastagonospora nodorum]
MPVRNISRIKSAYYMCASLHARQQRSLPAWLAQSVERETLRFHFLRKRLIQSQGCGFDPRIGLDDSFFALFLIILGVGLELVIGQQQS